MSDNLRDKPQWSHWNKEGSLRAYAHWHNDLARASFLNDQGHPETYFFIAEDGGIQGCQFSPTIDPELKRSTILREAARIRPFGTIQIWVTTIQKVNGLSMIGKRPSDPSRHCLLVRVESRNGKEMLLANPIITTELGFDLEETVVVQQPHAG